MEQQERLSLYLNSLPIPEIDMSTSNFDPVIYIEELETQVSVLNNTVQSLKFELEDALLCNRGLLDAQKTLDKTIVQLTHDADNLDVMATDLREQLADETRRHDYVLNTQAEIIEELENKVLSTEDKLRNCKEGTDAIEHTVYNHSYTIKMLEKKVDILFDLLANK